MNDLLKARVALDEIEACSIPCTASFSRAILIIRSTLTTAAQEEADIAVVNRWLDTDDDRYQSSGRQYTTGYYFTLYPNQMREDRHPFYGATREEAISCAAEWCRKDMAK